MDDILIVGGGIGGLTLGLALHAAKIPCRIFETAPEIRAVGVGVNLLPHATKESWPARTYSRETQMGLETIRRRIEERFSRLASARISAALRRAGRDAVRHVSTSRFLSSHAPRGV